MLCRLPLLFISLLVACTHSASAITFLVTTNADNGPGSLRQAILDANATPGGDTIHFAIGSGAQTIRPTDALPVITDTVTIDGTTQPGYEQSPIIELSGENLSLINRSGLTLRCSGSAVVGLVINRCSRGIRIETGTGNLIAHNYIGTDLSGMVARRNTCGIDIRSDSSATQIGLPTPAGRNLISGNQDAIFLEGSPGNVIEGNFIGTARDGISPLRNDRGIVLYGRFNTIGGTSIGARNIISGNGVGVSLVGASLNVIEGNFIGPDITGLQRVPNVTPQPPSSAGSGVYLLNAPTNTIGGTSRESRNVISGNGGYGIFVDGETSQGSVIQGNWIGLNALGDASLSNHTGGVRLHDACNNSIGGTERGAGNVISANGFFGILLAGRSTNNVVRGNYVGTDPFGQSAIPNLGKGIVVSSARNLIGGTEPSARNIISGNVGPGIQVGGSDAIANVIQGNYIGVNAQYSAALPNTTWGVLIVSGTFTTVGGWEPGAGNVISGNQSGGVWIAGFYAVTNVLHGNFIGSDPSGNAGIPNRGPGVLLASLARNNLIGGTAPGEGNTIAFNTGDGVVVQADAIGNPILANSIHSNGRLGINLQPTGEGNGVVTSNDPGDGDTGPNNLQNFPVITNVVYLSNNTIIQGYLRSSTNGSFSIDVYANVATEQSGYGEGQFYLGNVDVDTDENGFTQFAFVTSGAFSNQFFTATALNYDTADTSEFSAAMGGIRIAAIERIASQYRVSFSTITNHTYVLQRASNLNSSMSWSPVVLPPQPIQGTGGIVTVSDTAPGTDSMRIYRVFQQP